VPIAGTYDQCLEPVVAEPFGAPRLGQHAKVRDD
jgi:hypothetical protein